MGTYKVRYMVPKKKKNHTLYYWQPKKQYYPHFMTMPLGKDFAQAVIQAEKYNAELDAWRKTGIEPNAVREGSIAWLNEQYQKSMWFSRLAPNTRKGYVQNIARINKWAGKSSIAALNRKVCKSYYNELCKESISSANALMRVIKLVFSFALEEGLVAENPVKGVRLLGTKARHQVWSDDEVDVVVRHCLDNNRTSMAVAIILARDMAQRQEDIMRLQWAQYDGNSITITQGKTGKRLILKCTVRAKETLDKLCRTHDGIIVNENTGKPYEKYTFRRIASEMINGAGVEDRYFMDLRRTAASEMAEAGCTSEELTSRSGHSIEKGSNILEVYVPRSTAMSSNAVEKVEAYRKKKLEQKVGTD